MASDLANESFMKVQQKYAEERSKRLREDAADQYIDLARSKQFQHFQADPWIHAEPPPETSPLSDGKVEYLVLGAGFGGLLTAVRLIEAGAKAEDIRLVDQAGGFGGTWYWNRYPGLMCDVESYLYLPLLEEMDYIPKHRYSYGQEIRNYINLIAKKYDLTNKLFFSTTISSLKWIEEEKRWRVDMSQQQLSDGSQLPIVAHARFVFSASGVLNWPKIPNIPGISDFKGHIFHTSRWDYARTGGSQDDPQLVNLKGKSVGVIGTGATAVQVVPELAKWAEKLYVFQRTPSAVDVRGQKQTDEEWFNREVRNKKNWQRERNANFHAFVCSHPELPEVNMVNDGWTTMPSYKAVIGGPNQITGMESIPAHVASLHQMDFPRQERIRQRVSDIVKDPVTAEKLKPWYPGFCKRPCFHDDYLPCFNRDNVELVDTDGSGVERFTEHGMVVAGKEYPIDYLVLSTGFRSSAGDTPASRANLVVEGRNGRNIDEKFKQGWGSLHGQLSRDFPNMFLCSPLQAAASVNFSFVLDQFAQHAAYIIHEARAKAEEQKAGDRFTIEPTEQAEQDWSMQCMMRAGAMAGMSGCTPSYINNEGATDKLPMEERMKRARLSIWGEGIEKWISVIEDWRNKGALEGLEISVN